MLLSDSVVEGQGAQRVPPWIGWVEIALAIGLVVVNAALGAQAGAIIAAERLLGQIEEHGVSDGQLEVHFFALELVGLAVDRCALEHLANRNREGAAHRCETTAAFALVFAADVAVHDDAVRDVLEHDLDGERCCGQARTRSAAEFTAGDRNAFGTARGRMVQ